MRTPKLTITLPHEKGRVPAQSLVAVIQDTIGLLKELQKAKGVRQGDLQEWSIVAVEMHSPLTLTIAPAGRGPAVAREFLTAMRSLQTRAARPKHFSDTALAIVSKLSTVVSRTSESLRFSLGRRSVSLTRKAFQNLEAIQSRRHGFSANLELDGRLETVSLHGEQYFCIYDRLSGEPIRCSFSEAIPLERITELLTRRARVRVRGLVRYNKVGAPVHVDVSSCEELPEQRDLPQIEDVHAAGVNITQGVDSVEYIRKMRDGE